MQGMFVTSRQNGFDICTSPDQVPSALDSIRAAVAVYRIKQGHFAMRVLDVWIDSGVNQEP
jgi:hypothetical protein